MKKIMILLVTLMIINVGLLSGCTTPQPNESENISPTISISANPTNGTVPLTVSFTGLGIDPDGAIESYYWDFDDGTTSSEKKPTHTFHEAKTFHVILTVTDDSGLTANDSITINVYNALYWIRLVNKCSRHLEVYVETKTNNFMTEKKFDLAPYWLRFLLRNYQKIIILSEVGLVNGGDVIVTITAYAGRNLLKKTHSSISVPSNGNIGIEFTFYPYGIPEKGLVTYRYLEIVPF